MCSFKETEHNDTGSLKEWREINKENVNSNKPGAVILISDKTDC